MTLLKEEEPQLKWIQEYGNIIKYYGIFNEPTLFVADTRIIQEITLNKVYDFIKPPKMLADAIIIAGKGIVLAEGEDHKRQRKMMNPAFSHNNVKEMIPTFIRVAFTLKDLIEDKVNLGESEINLTPYISKATLDVIGLVGFNYEFNSLTSSNELAEAYDSLLNEKMTDEELKYQIMTFLIAGHETTSVSTCWALYLLAQHPREQDLLREELVKAFPDKSKFNPTFDEINSLEYLNCIVKETLRIHSPAPFTTRTNLNDETFGEYFIPKDTTIMVAISALHKSPEIWGSTAKDFDPQRCLINLRLKICHKSFKINHVLIEVFHNTSI
ncbi:unnamed protein product [Rhizophagus irregularis]|nr:unnamed protein product [Rhizophagus irregularis]